MIEPTKSNYLVALQRLLPRGAAWPRSEDATLTKLLRGLVGVYVAVHIRLDQLLKELDPRDTSDLLPEWEGFAGLPDSCCTGSETIAERRQAIVTKLTNKGNPMVQYYLDLAASLGEAGVTITEFTPSTCEMACDGPLIETPWRFVWQVNIPNRPNVRTAFRVGSRCGQRVDVYAKGRLECQLKRQKPAYTYVQFNYGEA
jgi:uncharacterized protein YmfQ (DUF2313 family)